MTDYRSSFKRNFIAGLVTILPLWLTFLVIWLVFRWVGGFASPFLRPLFHYILGSAQSELLVRITSFFLSILVIWFIGLLATHIVGRRILLTLESVFLRLPVLRDIYTSMRKFIQQFTNKRSFQKVVLVEFPRNGIYSVGFVTMDGVGEVQRKTKEHVINVFVPTTPNPTTGFLVMIPEDQITPLDMTIDEAFRFIVSGGIMVPEEKAPGIIAPSPAKPQ